MERSGSGTTVCPRCEGGRMVTFGTKGDSPAAQVPPQQLPTACADCGLVVVDGKAVQLPEQVEKATQELADTMAEAVEKAREGLEADTDRLEQYLRNLYRTAYLDGFFRALGYSRYQQRPGRLKRLRELWRRRMARDADSIGLRPEHVLVAFPRDLYTEIGELLELGAPPGEADAAHSTYESPAQKQS